MTGSQNTPPPASQPTGQRQRVHIRITYAGKGQPGPKLAERCETLVDMLVEADAGVIDGRKTGGGAADVYVFTRFSKHTIETARRIANELGIGNRTTIKISDSKVEG